MKFIKLKKITANLIILMMVVTLVNAGSFPAHAVDYDSEGRVEFVASTDKTDPVDPKKPEDPVTPLGPDGNPSPGGTVSTDETGMFIKNDNACFVAILLRETKKELKPNLKLNDVFPNRVNARNVISTNIQNKEAMYMDKMIVKAKVTKKGESDVLVNDNNSWTPYLVSGSVILLHIIIFWIIFAKKRKTQKNNRY